MTGFISMIVCLCRNVKTSQIVEAVKGGARSVDQVREATGAASCCGKCQFMVNALVTDHSDDNQCDYYNAATG
ncbi:MAG: (2Fe-2S)-binding protein [Pseudomonadales bacterium]